MLSGVLASYGKIKERRLPFKKTLRFVCRFGLLGRHSPGDKLGKGRYILMKSIELPDYILWDKFTAADLKRSGLFPLSGAGLNIEVCRKPLSAKIGEVGVVIPYFCPDIRTFDHRLKPLPNARQSYVSALFFHNLTVRNIRQTLAAKNHPCFFLRTTRRLRWSDMTRATLNPYITTQKNIFCCPQVHKGPIERARRARSARLVPLCALWSTQRRNRPMNEQTFMFSYCPVCGSPLTESLACSVSADRLETETRPVLVFGALVETSLCGSCRAALEVS